MSTLDKIISLINESERFMVNQTGNPRVYIAKVPYGKLDEIDSEIIFKTTLVPRISIVQTDNKTSARFIAGKLMNHDILIEEYKGDDIQAFVNLKDL